jgi:hypothetical protein
MEEIIFYTVVPIVIVWMIQEWIWIYRYKRQQKENNKSK